MEPTKRTNILTRKMAIDKISENWVSYLSEQVLEENTEVLEALVRGVGAKSISLLSNSELEEEYNTIFGEVISISCSGDDEVPLVSVKDFTVGVDLYLLDTYKKTLSPAEGKAMGCPSCGSTTFSKGDFVDGGTLSCRTDTCSSCGVSWECRFNLTAVRVLNSKVA